MLPGRGPAATLLLPYFEVDLTDPNGLTTIFSVSNATPDPALVHLIFWTDWAFATISFNEFLTGYDVMTVNLRDLFQGNIPITADEQSDPTDSISPQGRPEWDGSFSSCNSYFPYYKNPMITGIAYDRFYKGHTGAYIASLPGCVGADFGDGHARGYLTIDSVSVCSTDIDPGDSYYFIDGGVGRANDENVLMGEYYFVDYANQTMVAQQMVHIEADPDFGVDSTPIGYTFYGDHINMEGGYFHHRNGADNREPLGTIWGAPYFDDGSGNTTEFVVWRDVTEEYLTASIATCGSSPRWAPLPETQVLCFDEKENSVELPAATSRFPIATQRVAASDLDLPFLSGWCRLNLNHYCPGCSIPGGFGPSYDIAQSNVTVIRRLAGSAGQRVDGLPAVELADACSVQVRLIFKDGFESGNVSAWTAKTP